MFPPCGWGRRHRLSPKSSSFLPFSRRKDGVKNLFCFVSCLCGTSRWRGWLCSGWFVFLLVYQDRIVVPNQGEGGSSSSFIHPLSLSCLRAWQTDQPSPEWYWWLASANCCLASWRGRSGNGEYCMATVLQLALIALDVRCNFWWWYGSLYALKSHIGRRQKINSSCECEAFKTLEEQSL